MFLMQMYLKNEDTCHLNVRSNILKLHLLFFNSVKSQYFVTIFSDYQF